MDLPANNVSGPIEIQGATLCASDVQIIIAESGLDPGSRTKPVIWARNIVVAGGKRYVSAEAPNINASDFENWLVACPQAVGIMTDGAIRLPRVSGTDNTDHLAILTKALSAARRAISLQMARAFIMSGVLCSIGISLVAILYFESTAHPFSTGLFKFGAVGVVLTLAGAIAGVPGLAVTGQRIRLGRILDELEANGTIRSDLLARSIAAR